MPGASAFRTLFAQHVLPRRLYGTGVSAAAGMRPTGVDDIQAKYLSEPCIEVSADDEVVGSVSKLECHRAPILHRAFSVFVFNPECELLLQKRSPTKITFPNTWTNACCSHPHFVPSEMEETPNALGIRRAAKRKLLHELGIDDVALDQIHFMGRFIYQAKSHPMDNDVSDATWMEHELDYALVVPHFTGDLKLNAEEVAEVRYVKPNELDEMLRSKEYAFSPWFRLFAQFRWLTKWWHAVDDLGSVTGDLRKIHQLN